MIHLDSHKKLNYTVYGVTLFFFLLSLWGVSQHELWLDEAHHYLLARDSSSFQNLITNTRYEGHPILWNLLLYWITWFSTNPFWMQVLHVSIMTVTVGVFLKRAPFSWLFKLLFIFGYFMFYEYNLLSRNYSLGILFVFLACTLYPKRDHKFIPIAILLGIACNSHSIFIILSGIMMAMIFLERLLAEKKVISKQTWVGIGIFGALALLALFQVIPPTDTSFFEQGERISAIERMAKSMTPFFKSIFIIPDVTISSFWNSNLLVNYSKPIAAAIAVASLSLPYLLFYKNRMLLLYVYFGILATAVLFFIISMNAARYYGILYLFVITALWFDAYAFAKAKKRFTPLENTLKKLRPVLIYSILGLHFLTGIYAFTMDITRPFTTAKQTAQFLNQNNLSNKIIASKACNGTALSAYLEKPLYFTKTQSFESFCTFNRPSIYKEQSAVEVLKSIKNQLKPDVTSIIYITYEPFFDTTKTKEWHVDTEQVQVVLLAAFKGSILNKGDHYIYEISRY